MHESIQEHYARSVDDPVYFTQSVLGDDPWLVQRKIMEAVRDYPRVGVPSCHGSGKSWVAARIALWFLITHPHSLVFTTAPTARQVEAVLWKEISSCFHRAKFQLPGRMYQISKLTIDTDWYAFGFSTDRPDAFQGLHARYILGIFDEATGISPDLWDAAEGNLSAGHSRLLTIGNPTDPSARFFMECEPKNQVEAGGRTKVIPISVYDTPNFLGLGITEKEIADGSWKAILKQRGLVHSSLVKPSFAADLYEKWGPEHPQYVSRVLGRFPETSEDALIPWAAIEAAVERHKQYRHDPEQATVKPEGEIVVGVDVADQGADTTVRMIRQGGYVTDIRQTIQEHPLQTAGRIAADLREHPTARAIVDNNGIGRATELALREQGFKVRGVTAQSRARDTQRFYRLKDELYWELREWFVEGKIAIPYDEDLMKELAVMKMKIVDSSGKIQVTPKDEMRRMLNRSPDKADALMLTFAGGATPYVDYVMPEEKPAETDEEYEVMRDHTIRRLMRLNEDSHSNIRDFGLDEY